MWVPALISKSKAAMLHVPENGMARSTPDKWRSKQGKPQVDPFIGATSVDSEDV